MKSLFKKQKLQTPKVKSFEEQLKYKIKVEQYGFKLRLYTTINRGLLTDFYKEMSKRVKDLKEGFDELDKSEFSINKDTLGALHSKLKKTYESIEEEVANDWNGMGKQFKMTYIETESCTFTKKGNQYDVEILSSGYWQ